MNKVKVDKIEKTVEITDEYKDKLSITGLINDEFFIRMEDNVTGYYHTFILEEKDIEFILDYFKKGE